MHRTDCDDSNADLNDHDVDEDGLSHAMETVTTLTN